MIKIHAIVNVIISYGDSSQILKALSWDKGHISILAKGWRKKQEALLRFCEYEFSLYEPKEEGLYLLKEACLINEFITYPNTQTWAAAEAGIELISRILIPASESNQYYTTLREYLVYLQKTRTNGILIFWRLFLRVFILLGIDSAASLCSICGKAMPVFAVNSSSEHLCEECFASRGSGDSFVTLSSSSRKILSLLPEIGLHLDSILVSPETVAELNRYFTSYYSAHQKQTLKLKSLSVLSQFY